MNKAQETEVKAMDQLAQRLVGHLVAPEVMGKAEVVFVEIVDLVRRAAVPGGIGEHEFKRAGGWLDQAKKALAVFDAACTENEEGIAQALAAAGKALPFHLFEIEAEGTDGTMCYFVSAQGATRNAAQDAAKAKVFEDMDEDGAEQDDVIGSVEYLGMAEAEICSKVGPYAA